jgi:hypothetical protein
VARHPDKVRLLFGPYTPPPLRKGDRTSCLYRDANVVVTGWSDGRSSWPRYRALGVRGGSGLLVEEELARAVRRESAAAIMYWFGVSCSTVWLWRKALGVEGRAGTDCSCRLIQAAAEKGAAQLRGQPLPPEQVERRRRTARELNLGENLRRAARARAWPAGQLRLLGTAPDAELARRIGRSANAVRVMRTRLGIPDPGGHGWTAEEVALLGTAPDAEVATRIGRSVTAVMLKRCLLGLPTFGDRRVREGRAGATAPRTGSSSPARCRPSSGWAWRRRPAPGPRR